MKLLVKEECNVALISRIGLTNRYLIYKLIKIWRSLRVRGALAVPMGQ
jgi:hypothetical protein